METCLLREGALEYRVSDEFRGEMLAPVIENHRIPGALH